MRATTGTPLPRRVTDVDVLTQGSRTIVTTGDGSTLELNPTARAVLDLCDGATRAEEMSAALCDVFDVDPRTADAEVTNVLRQLAAAGLVTPSLLP